MSEQNDKPLHDWVRKEMNTYRPTHDPTDWTRMQHILKRRQWWRTGTVSVVSLLLTSLLSWLMLTTQPDKEPMANRRVNKLVVPSLPKRTKPYSATPNQLIMADKKRETTNPVSHEEKPIVSKQSVNRPVVQTPAPLTTITDISQLVTSIDGQIHRVEPVAFSSEEAAIGEQMRTGDFGIDSTTYRTLTRNLNKWPDAVLVCDLTTSMYPYTTQIFVWLKQNARKPLVKGAVFFTDCDSSGNQTRPGGPPGRMFVTHELSSGTVLPVLLNATRNTVRNKDDAENNIEALLVAQQQFPETKHFILIADNMSTVKDMALLYSVKKPVHIVLCGTTGSEIEMPFQADYYTIARQTHGTLHTLEDDLNPAQLSPATTLRVGPHYYRYNTRKKSFKRTSFNHRPKRFLNLFWF